MNNEYNQWKQLMQNLGKSKRDLLNFLISIDGEDSDEYFLYDKHVNDENFDLFMNKFWLSDPDCTLSYILNFIEFMEIIDYLKIHNLYTEEIQDILMNWNADHVSKFKEMAAWDEDIVMEIQYFNFYTVEGGYVEDETDYVTEYIGQDKKITLAN